MQASTAIERLLDMRPRAVPGLQARRVVLDGQPAHLLHNPLSARFYRADPTVAVVLARLDGRRTVRQAIVETGDALRLVDRDGILAALASMISAGLLLLPGAPPPRRALGWQPRLWQTLGNVLYLRVEIGDLGGLVCAAAPVLGPLFSAAGLACFMAVLAAAVLSLAGQSDRLWRDLAGIFNLGWSDVVGGAVLFLAVKLLHEVGHAVAAVRMGRAEGIPLRVFRFGAAAMFGMPTLFIDVTAVWAIAARWRRAVVGLGGVYIETWLTALAVIAWAWTRDGGLGDWPLRLMLISGVSTLLFNLNPLVRLDGYYVMSDLFGTANLQARGRLATRALLARCFGGAGALPSHAVPVAAWNIASTAYRWTVFLAAFWAAAHVHWGLAAVLGISVLGLFVAQPALAALGWMRRGGIVHRARAGFAVSAILVGLAGALLVPLPARVVAEGVVESEGHAFVFAPADGRITSVAPAGPVPRDGELIALSNGEALLLRDQLALDSRAVEIRLREAAIGDPGRLGPFSSREQALRDQRATVEAEIASWQVRAPQAAMWQPVRAESLVGAWVRRDDVRPLGVRVPENVPQRLEVALDQEVGPRALEAMQPGQLVRARLRDRQDLAFDAAWLDGRPAAGNELPSPALGIPGGGRIAVERDDPRGLRVAERIYVASFLVAPGSPHLPEGAVADVRIELAPAPLASQLWDWARRVMQRRLAE